MLVACVALLSSAEGYAAGAAEARVYVGVGRADITPLTGGYKGGWACSCAQALGQHTRLYARVVVIKEGRRKIALVAEDLSFLGAGMVRDAVAIVKRRGFSERNVIDSATHTHGSQTGFMNFGTYNSVLPKSGHLTKFNITNTAADPTLYSFMVRQLAKAIARADDDLAPGAVGWGHTDLLGVTQNRSLEAHLANYGIKEPPGTGNVNQDPGGYRDTIDPSVDVLRVDRLRHGRRVPVGMYSAFADHGTVVKPTFSYFTADHQGAAERVVEATVRRAGHVPRSQDVVNAFADSDAGDMTAGIVHNGPAQAEWVGRREADAMMKAWRAAGRSMTAHPALDLRWTRVCMCGQGTSDGATDSTPVIGQAAGAGSEELRTIFYDEGLAREGDMLPADVGPQGDKVQSVRESGNVPQAIPMAAVRLGNRMIVSIPGEATVGVGKMVRRAVIAVSGGAGIARVVIAGYADEYLSYWTTPAEYERQHYEGGFTLYGRTASLVLRDTLAELARRLVTGKPAPAPYAYDPNEGVHPTGAGYGLGAKKGKASMQPKPVGRLGHVAFSWHGGANGLDRPVDRPFVTVQRRAGRRWRRVADDLGMQIVWSSDSNGGYLARWEVPLSARRGRYRFLVTAKRYRLTSRTFRVRAAALIHAVARGGRLLLRYPHAVIDQDWTYRPSFAAGGAVTFLVDGRRFVVHESRARMFAIPAGAHVVVPAGGARDRYGNTNAARLVIR